MRQRLIESDSFPIEFLSSVAERESWRKEIHRPIYHVHKWWANRLGSVFRGILLACVLPEDCDLPALFSDRHDFSSNVVFDPFMGSGTTVGEAHKLGLTALGRDINPVAVQAVRVALGELDLRNLQQTFDQLSGGVGEKIRALYRSKDSSGRPCDVLYFFWVMQARCPNCAFLLDLFASRVFARNAYPGRKPAVHVVCPSCGGVSPSLASQKYALCIDCSSKFDVEAGVVKGEKATCPNCSSTFSILKAVGGQRPPFRLYAKLVLTCDGLKEYLATTGDDELAYANCSQRLHEETDRGLLKLPTLALQDGHNTRQAMKYGFAEWRDFFNERQLLGLGLLHQVITQIDDSATRDALLILFSGVLEFNNVFASYKGEGTGAVRHMFAHHILKPERTPIEANIWGTRKSSGSFSTLFRSRLLKAIEYRNAPRDIDHRSEKRRVISAAPFSGQVLQWPSDEPLRPRGIYVSCGDSSETQLPDQAVDLIVTDPPFFDNVHYSELADFFYSWLQLSAPQLGSSSTRSDHEVQDADVSRFAEKLREVLKECHRVLKDEGLLVFTYHHSRDEGWLAVARSIFESGFVVVNSQPLKSEMSVATPKAKAKDPIQLDIVVVCKKRSASTQAKPTVEDGLRSAHNKVERLRRVLGLSRNDIRVTLFGQMLTVVESAEELKGLSALVDKEAEALSAEIAYPPAAPEPARRPENPQQQSLWTLMEELEHSVRPSRLLLDTPGA